MTALACIADDFTGGTDVAAALRRAGLSVTLLFGTPAEGLGDTTTGLDTDAVVIALKTRTIPAGHAVAQSLQALAWLDKYGVDRLYFKYCSTFDSTDEGNIGPVADALLDARGEQMSLVCPASPEHGRTTYLGHLFVGEQLVSDSPMSDHPLTPMHDPRLVHMLARQTTHAVGLLPLPVIAEGPAAVRRHLMGLRAEDVRHVVVDATTTDHLRTIVDGASDLLTMTGGAGLAGALGASLSGADLTPVVPVPQLPAGGSVVLAGSCSAATRAQVAAAVDAFPSYRLDPVHTPTGEELYAQAAQWLHDTWSGDPVLIYSSAGPDDRRRATAAMGPETADILERSLGRLAADAVALGAERIIVAGGETSGAVVQALEVGSVIVAGEADRGVPWCLTSEDRPLALLLKSGNFGAEDLLVRATKGQL